MPRRSALLLAAALGLGCAALLGLGCAAAPGAAWREQHPDFERRAPEAGAPLGAVLASLEQDEPAVSLASLRLLELGSDPWLELADEEQLLARARGDALHALLAERVCRRAGLTGGRLRRASWFLFQGGRLSAWDAFEFSGDCEVEHHFRPAPAALAGIEEDLERTRARRFSASAAGPERIFRNGLIYLEHGRAEAAAAALARGERMLGEASRAARKEDAAPGADAALAPARRLRRELRRALRQQQDQGADPSERFWKGQ